MFLLLLLGMFSIIFILSLSLGHVPEVGKTQSEIILLWEVLLTLKVQAELWLVYCYLEISFAVVPKADFIFIFKGKKKRVLIKYLSLWWLKGGSKALRMRNYL